MNIADSGIFKKNGMSISLIYHETGWSVSNVMGSFDIVRFKVTAAIAKAFTESEFEKFRILQDRAFQSDFDKFVADTSDL